MFTLNERLRSDTVEIGRLDLSLLLLMNDRSLPWFILVPEREGIREIDELQAGDRSLLIEEVARVTGAIRRLYNPDKINIGALGNLVPQFHMHVIGRFASDRAWPGPVWGTGPVEKYGPDEMDGVLSRIRTALNMWIK
ncbi:MAG TPA: HIT family protein [Dissulfurispiraceae bacterium]|nr:HIT family protein [Dissulfurispiraceae bacterium]